MAFLTNYTIILDGIDKCGKDTIRQFIWHLDKRLNVFCRGWPSLVVYAKKFDRNCIYAWPNKDTLYVHLDVEKDDWNIRCSITHEPKINYDEDSKLFNDAFQQLRDRNYYVMYCNTSYSTPYEIAKDIVKRIHEINESKGNNV